MISQEKTHSPMPTTEGGQAARVNGDRPVAAQGCRGVDRVREVEAEAGYSKRLSKSVMLRAGIVLNETDNSLLKAIEAFMALCISGKFTMITRSISPSITYPAVSSPPFCLIKAIALSVRLALTDFKASREYFPNIRYVDIFTFPFIERMLENGLRLGFLRYKLSVVIGLALNVTAVTTDTTSC
jgi:hypothetical protein